MNTTDKAIDLVVQLEKRIAELERDQATLLRAIESWKKEELSWIEDGKALHARIAELESKLTLYKQLGIHSLHERIAELEAENTELKRRLQEAKVFLTAIHMTDEKD